MQGLDSNGYKLRLVLAGGGGEDGAWLVED